MISLERPFARDTVLNLIPLIKDSRNVAPKQNPRKEKTKKKPRKKKEEENEVIS